MSLKLTEYYRAGRPPACTALKGIKILVASLVSQQHFSISAIIIFTITLGKRYIKWNLTLLLLLQLLYCQFEY